MPGKYKPECRGPDKFVHNALLPLWLRSPHRTTCDRL